MVPIAIVVEPPADGEAGAEEDYRFTHDDHGAFHKDDLRIVFRDVKNLRVGGFNVDHTIFGEDLLLGSGLEIPCS